MGRDFEHIYHELLRLSQLNFEATLLFMFTLFDLKISNDHNDPHPHIKVMLKIAESMVNV